MPRRSLEPGTWGEITTTKEVTDAGTLWRCRAKFRAFDGRARVIQRSAPTRKAARQALDDALSEASAQGQGVLTSQDTFETAVTAWLDDLAQLVAMGERSPSTLDHYRHTWTKHVSPALGGLRLAQVTVPVVDRFIVSLHGKIGPATARTSRAIVSGAMGRAVREGAVASNPARDVRRLSIRPKKAPRALTDEERTRWFLALAQSEVAVRHELPQLSAFMLATGVRIGEALALVWREVDLVAGTAHITSTLIRVKGEGLIRKDTKTQAGDRPLVLPLWCVAMLRERASVGVGPDEPVFGSINGTFRDPRNVSRWMAQARQDAGLEWMTSHSWRKTTASVLDGSGLPARVIADQLGHSRVSMTQDVYLGRRMADPRVVEALELINPRLALGREKSDETSDEPIDGEVL